MNFKIRFILVSIVISLVGFLSWLYIDKKNNKIMLNNNNLILKNNDKTEKIIDKNIQNELSEKIKSDFINYFDKYLIQKWDTMSKIARDHGISNFEDLIVLNSLLWVEFKYKNGNKNSVILQIWYKMYVPKYGMLWIINNKVDQLKKIQYTLELNNKINSDIAIDVWKLWEELYPNMVQWVWIEKMLKWFINTQKQEFDPYFPRIVDIRWQNAVSCANLIRTLLSYSVNKQKLTDKEKLFFQAQWLDAWILPLALKEIWYVQKFNLMNHFSEYLVWTSNPILAENQKSYDNDIIKVWKYLETNWIVWSILPFYFRYSDYTKIVASYNRNKEEKHYNTHQSVLAWIDTISFEARKVWYVRGGQIIKFDDLETKEMTVFDFLTSFVQQRWDYWVWSLMNWTKKVVQDNLHIFHSLVNIKVNWKQIDLSKEFKKDKEKMFKIKPDDKIEIYWPIMIDGIHMLSSPDISRRINMNARTRFYFEFIIIWKFLQSELLEPQENVLWIGVKNDDIIWELDVKGVYSINVWDTVEKAIKDKVLKYEKDSFDNLDKNSDNYDLNYKKLLDYYYSQQIKALKMAWYMQSENNINPSSFNINAPIPYFDNNNISKVFTKYVSNMKNDIIIWNTDIYMIKNFVQVTTFPLDSYKTLLNRIIDELKIYFSNNNYLLIDNLSENSYSSIDLFLEFNELQQRKFLDIFLNKSQKTKKIVSTDFLNGKISEWITMVLSLNEVNKIIYDIAKETYTPNLNLNPVDEFSIDLVIKLDQNRNVIENILYMESYIPTWSYWIRRLVKQFLENNSFLQQSINIFWKRFGSKITSYWDFQLRLSNLYKWINEEWLNKDQLLKAFSYLKTNKFEDYVVTLDSISKRRVKYDLEIVNDINILLLDYENVDEKTKKDYREDIVSKLQKILVLDDWTWRNIVWKIIWVSLLNDKINLHFQKLNWILQASWENLSNIYNDSQSMESYEKLTILINNLWELKVVYWLAENYFIRIFDIISNKIWKKYEYPKLKTTSTLWHFVYWKNTFLNNLLVYKDIIWNMRIDLKNTYDTKDAKYLLINSTLTNLEQIIDWFYYEDDNRWNIVKIYDFFKNTKIKESLVLLNDWNDANLITSILPLKSEFVGINFRYVFFRYINNRSIERKWPWFISKIVSLLR